MVKMQCLPSALKDCSSLCCAQSVRKPSWLLLENTSQIRPLCIPATTTTLVQPSVLPGELLPPLSLQGIFTTEASLMLLKNKADYITPLLKMHQTLPRSYRITSTSFLCSGRTDMLCPHLCSSSDLDSNVCSLTHSSPAPFPPKRTSYIPGKGSRAFSCPSSPTPLRPQEASAWLPPLHGSNPCSKIT